jgi:hypothetical protein
MPTCDEDKKEEVLKRTDDSKDERSTQNSKEKEEDIILKKSANDNDDDVEISEAKQAHYSIFCLLFMLGFLMHCRKYPEETYTSISIAHIVVFISVPRATTTWYQDITFLSFCSFCLFSMLQDSPYNANHHNM